MKKLILLTIITMLTACGEYIPHTVFELKTTNGETIKLSCPVIDQSRSKLNYLIDGDCIIHK